MNNTAYQSLKKLFLTSLVLFAGTAIAQTNNNADMLGTHKPGVTSKPATTSTSEVKPVTSKNISTKPDVAPVSANRKTRVQPAKSTATATNANVAGSHANTQSQIDDITAKLARHPDMPVAKKKALTARLDALKKGEGSPDQKK